MSSLHVNIKKTHLYNKAYNPADVVSFARMGGNMTKIILFGSPFFGILVNITHEESD
jgi:hypothetical protein